MNKQQYKDSFSQIHAADDMAWRVQQKIALQKQLRKNIKVAVLAGVLLLFGGGGTAYAAIPEFRQAVIAFFTEGTVEDIPAVEKKLTDENTQPEETNDEAGEKVTVGGITLINQKSLDTHITANYFSSDDYLDIVTTASGRTLVYEISENGDRTYYAYENHSLKQVDASVENTKGTVKLGKLPGVMADGHDEYGDILLPEMSFEIQWMRIGQDIEVCNGSRDFDIGSTFGGTLNGKPIDGEYDGCFYARGLSGSSEWIQVFFEFDGQRTNYAYPFLFQVQTGEVRDPIADIDLSMYSCIMDLCIDGDMQGASAQAGSNPDDLHEIRIDFQKGTVIDLQSLACPVEHPFYGFATGEHTYFYALGQQSSVDGYIYDNTTKATQQIFADCAWGYTWSKGFSDQYVALIGGNYAAYYREAENEVYLLNLVTGEKKLLEQIPASHDVSYFWNAQKSLLSITYEADGGDMMLAFFDPAQDTAYYFTRKTDENVQEYATMWNGERRYVIYAKSPDDKTNYLFVYDIE